MEFAPENYDSVGSEGAGFMHFETLYYVTGLLLQRLVRLCDTQ